PALDSSVNPIIRQPALRLAQNLQHSPPILTGKMRKRLTPILPRQHFPQSPVNPLPSGLRQMIKGLRINQVAARVPKHPMRQIELPERAPTLIERPNLLELSREPRRAPNRARKSRLIPKKHVSNQRISRPSDSPRSRLTHLVRLLQRLIDRRLRL